MFSEKTVLVTGGTRGIGREIAAQFAKMGAQVIISSRKQTDCESVALDLSKGCEKPVIGISCDVSETDSIDNLVEMAIKRVGQIDILINNAGIVRYEPIDAPSFEEGWGRSLDILLTAQVMLARECLPHLEASGGGRIVNIASTEGLGATKGVSAYTASKTGVIGLTRSLAVELGMKGITVNCICPGPINTGMTADIPDESKAIFAARRSALKRYAEPEEVAHGTLNYVLPASQYITGTHLAVDGGLTIKNA